MHHIVFYLTCGCFAKFERKWHSWDICWRCFLILGGIPNCVVYFTLLCFWEYALAIAELGNIILYFSSSLDAAEKVPLESIMSKQQIILALITWSSVDRTTPSLHVDCITNFPPNYPKVDCFFHCLVFFRCFSRYSWFCTWQTPAVISRSFLHVIQNAHLSEILLLFSQGQSFFHKTWNFTFLIETVFKTKLRYLFVLCMV